MMSFQFLHLLVRPPLSNNGPTRNSRECICAQNHQQDPRVHPWAGLKKQNTDYTNTNTNPNLKIKDTFQNQFTLCGTCRKYCNKVWLQSKESLLKTVNISNCGLGKKTLQSIALKSANKQNHKQISSWPGLPSAIMWNGICHFYFKSCIEPVQLVEPVNSTGTMKRSVQIVLD